jgi:hypothetical protein
MRLCFEGLDAKFEDTVIKTIVSSREPLLNWPMRWTGPHIAELADSEGVLACGPPLWLRSHRREIGSYSGTLGRKDRRFHCCVIATDSADFKILRRKELVGIL